MIFRVRNSQRYKSIISAQNNFKVFLVISLSIVQKIIFSIKDFAVSYGFGQLLLKKSLIENFIFCVVFFINLPLLLYWSLWR